LIAIYINQQVLDKNNAEIIHKRSDIFISDLVKKTKEEQLELEAILIELEDRVEVLPEEITDKIDGD
jgi:hypothetical protein